MAIGEWKSPDQWSEWREWLSAGLHARNRWRLPVLLSGLLFAQGRRTVTTWLRAAGVSDDYQDYYYFLAALGRNTESVSSRLLSLILVVLPLPKRLLAVIDDSPTKRYGPHVEGADIHHNPTPGPADSAYLYGHIWVTLSLAFRHPQWGALALPLRAMLYVRRQTIPTIPRERRWRFATKLTLAARLVEWLAPLVRKAGKTLWVVVDGGYTQRPFLQRVIKTGTTVVGRLRKDAHLRSLPPTEKPGQRRRRGRPRIYGENRISLAKRAGQPRGWQTLTCTLYNQQCAKTYKTFLATYRPIGGVIRGVLVKEEHGWFAFFCTDPDASVEEPSPTARRSSRTFTTSRKYGARVSSKSGISGPTLLRIISISGCTRSSNSGLGTEVISNSATGATRRGTIPSDVLHMPTAAKPCDS